MAARNAVLSQSPEFKEARIRAFSLATAIYDLLTFALVLWGQYNMLYEVSFYFYLFYYTYFNFIINKNIKFD